MHMKRASPSAACLSSYFLIFFRASICFCLLKDNIFTPQQKIHKKLDINKHTSTNTHLGSAGSKEPRHVSTRACGRDCAEECPPWAFLRSRPTCVPWWDPDEMTVNEQRWSTHAFTEEEMTQNQHLQGTKGVATTQINAKVNIHSNKRVFAKLYVYVRVHTMGCHIYICLYP